MANPLMLYHSYLYASKYSGNITAHPPTRHHGKRVPPQNATLSEESPPFHFCSTRYDQDVTSGFIVQK